MMLGGKGNNLYSNRAVGLRVSSSLYGTTVPLLYGRYRITPKLIWAGHFWSQPGNMPPPWDLTNQNVGKKSGKGGGKKGNSFIYYAAADWLLAHYPVQNLLTAWVNQNFLQVWQTTQTSVVPAPSGGLCAVPITKWPVEQTGNIYDPTYTYSASDFVCITGVYLSQPTTLAAGYFNDYGGDGPSLAYSATQLVPLWNDYFFAPGSGVHSSSPNIYNWAPADGPTVYFPASMQGQTVIIHFAVCRSAMKPTALMNLEPERFLASGSEYTTAPGQQIPYNWVSGVGSTQFDLGGTASFPQFSFEAMGAYDFWPEGGCDPADIIEDLVMSGMNYAADPPYAGQLIPIGHGLNLNTEGYNAADPTNPNVPLPAGAFLGDLTGMRNYCRANAISCSLYLDSQQSAKNVLTDLFDIANCAPVWSGSQLKAVPYSEVSCTDHGAIYVAPTASGPICDLDDSCFLVRGNEAPVTVDRKRQADAQNVIKLQHVDDGNADPTSRADYNDYVTVEVEQRSVAQFGPRPADNRQMTMITKRAVAQKVASVLVKRQAMQRNVYKFSLPVTYCFLEAMDLVTITDALLGLSKLPVRLTSVRESFDRERGWELACEAEKYVYGLSAPTPAESTLINPYAVNANGSPGDVNAPLFIEPPDSLVLRTAQSAGFWLWLGLSGKNPNWGGCVVWVSSDGTTYEDMGTVVGPSTMGVTTSDLAAAATGSPSGTLFGSVAVDLSESGGSLVNFTQTDAAAGRSLCAVIDPSGTFELISYYALVQTGAHQYGLDACYRGLYGTPILDHAAGAQFVRLDDSVFHLPLDTGWIGQTLHLKFTSFNTQGGGAQSLADVLPYTYAFKGGYNNFANVVKNWGTAVIFADAGSTGTGYSLMVRQLRAFHMTGGSWGVPFLRADGTSFTVPAASNSGGVIFQNAANTTGYYYAMYNPSGRPNVDGNTNGYNAIADTGTQIYLLIDPNAVAQAIFHGHVFIATAVLIANEPDVPGGGGFGGSGARNV